MSCRGLTAHLKKCTPGFWNWELTDLWMTDRLPQCLAGTYRTWIIAYHWDWPLTWPPFLAMRRPWGNCPRNVAYNSTERQRHTFLFHRAFVIYNQPAMWQIRSHSYSMQELVLPWLRAWSSTHHAHTPPKTCREESSNSTSAVFSTTSSHHRSRSIVYHLCSGELSVAIDVIY